MTRNIKQQTEKFPSNSSNVFWHFIHEHKHSIGIYWKKQKEKWKHKTTEYIPEHFVVICIFCCFILPMSAIFYNTNWWNWHSWASDQKQLNPSLDFLIHDMQLFNPAFWKNVYIFQDPMSMAPFCHAPQCVLLSPSVLVDSNVDNMMKKYPRISPQLKGWCMITLVVYWLNIYSILVQMSCVNEG